MYSEQHNDELKYELCNQTAFLHSQTDLEMNFLGLIRLIQERKSIVDQILKKNEFQSQNLTFSLAK